MAKCRRKKKQFCKYGHDTFVTGRYPSGECIQCLREKHPGKVGAPFKQFCPKGHDKDIEGRTKDGSCKKCRKDYLVNYRVNYNPIYYENNKEKILVQKKKYYKDNREKLIKEKLDYEIKKIKTDPKYKLTRRLRNRIRLALNGNFKSGSAVRDLGCTIEFLRQYLESKFYDGMTWDNWGEMWELDHIIPLFKFDLTNKDEFLMACNYTNLQPLTIPDHKKKTAREIKEYIKIIKSKKT